MRFDVDYISDGPPKEPRNNPIVEILFYVGLLVALFVFCIIFN